MSRSKTLPDSQAIALQMERPGLYRLLDSYGISYRRLAEPCDLSAAAVSNLATKGLFPRKAMRSRKTLDAFKATVETALRGFGVSERDLTDVLWKDGTHVRYEVFMQTRVPNTLTRPVLKHFRLGYDPFDSARLPEDPTAIFLTEAMQDLAADLTDRLNEGGIAALVGVTGMGKSWLRTEVQRRLLAESDLNRIVHPRRVNRTRLTETDISEAIILDINPQARLRASGERRMRQAQEAVQSVAEDGGRLILVLDEAHLMTPRALVLLKNFIEISDGYHRGLSVFLIAQPALENMLRGDPALREVWYRLALFHAPGLATRRTAKSRTLDDLAVEEYLAHKLRPFDNGTPMSTIRRVFEQPAIDALRAMKDRCINPMVFNRLVSIAMGLAHACDDERVTAEAVANATRSL